MNTNTDTVLNDFPVAEEKKNKKSNKTPVFKNYEDKRELAEKIFAELNERFVEVKIGKKIRKGFYMEDGTKQIGLLSQCHCLQTMVSLAEDFGLDFTVPNIVSDQKGTIRELMDIIIEDVLEDICRGADIDEKKGEHRFDDVTEYIFDSSPYNSSCFSVKYSNIDSITWVVTSFLLILKHHATIHEVCKWEKALVNVIRYGMRYIIDAYIVKKDDEDKSKGEYLEIGWNFTKSCKEPSLYFSYTVCECYLDFFETFKPFLQHLHDVRNNTEYYSPINKDLADKFEKEKAEYEKNRDRRVAEGKARHDPYNELVRIYRLINDIDDYAELTIDNEKTLYGELEAKCKLVAGRVWELTKKELAEKFFYNNLRDTVTEQEIRMSTTSDVLFNTAYIINIMLCAGLDETLELERIRFVHNKEKEEAAKKQQEYNNLLESCLLAEQKAFRTYEGLKNDGKEYIVDQFLVGFNEDFSGHEVSISELRKLRMRTFSLLPLLINTNTKVCEYLIKYPHYNMGKYYSYIMDNRLVDSEGEEHWIWERDGFFCGSNYYYVLALKGFYDYYEKYEEGYIEIGKENAVREKSIQYDFLKSLRAPDGEIGQLNDEIKKQKEEIEKKEELIAEKEEKITKLENARPTVEGTIRQLVIDVLTEEFAPLFANVLKQTSKVLALNMVDDTADDENNTYKKIYDSLFDMCVVSMMKRYCDPATDNEGNCAYLKTPTEYNKLKGKLGGDFAASIIAYVTNVSSLADDKSKSYLQNLFK
ncbi:MAG: hypothetical protein E7555_08495 [Ruminococcaceae bacterium]|nr:hypothetical protein [Oscillospiraceae bacterium]